MRWHLGTITSVYSYQLDDGTYEKRVAGHHERPEDQKAYRFKGNDFHFIFYTVFVFIPSLNKFNTLSQTFKVNR